MPKKLSKPPLNTTSTPPAFSHPSLPRCFTDCGPLPKLIVFDLDYTLWPFWVDTHPFPPLRPNADHTTTTDKTNEPYTFYPDVPPILHALSLNPLIKLGLASRTQAPDLAKDLLKQLWIYPPSPEDLDSGTPGGGSSSSSWSSSRKKSKRALDLFAGGMEIYPASKIRHFESLHRKTQVPYADMLFFDDERRNSEVETLGVTMWLVADGVGWGELERGVLEWRSRRGFMNMNGSAREGKEQ